MNYKEESYVLYTLKELKETIRSPTFKQFIKETHENNIMLKHITKIINVYLIRHNNENEEDFFRNVLANLLSSGIDINKLFKRK